MNISEIRRKLNDGNTIYLMDRFEGVVIRLSPNRGRVVEAFVKRRNRVEVPIERTAKIVFEAELNGETITKDEYDRF